MRSFRTTEEFDIKGRGKVFVIPDLYDFDIGEKVEINGKVWIITSLERTDPRRNLGLVVREERRDET